jgi:hypothetical protein
MAALRDAGRPITFEQMCEEAFGRSGPIAGEGFVLVGTERRLKASVLRSARRAMKKLIKDEAILVLGTGGPTDAHRYAFDPAIFGLVGEEDRYEAATAAFDADPGAKAFEDDKFLRHMLHCMQLAEQERATNGPSPKCCQLCSKASGPQRKIAGNGSAFVCRECAEQVISLLGRKDNAEECVFRLGED